MLEKSSKDIGSAVCYTIYTNYLSISLYTNSCGDIIRTVFKNLLVDKEMKNFPDLEMLLWATKKRKKIIDEKKSHLI